MSNNTAQLLNIAQCCVTAKTDARVGKNLMHATQVASQRECNACLQDKTSLRTPQCNTKAYGAALNRQVGVDQPVKTRRPVHGDARPFYGPYNRTKPYPALDDCPAAATGGRLPLLLLLSTHNKHLMHAPCTARCSGPETHLEREHNRAAETTAPHHSAHGALLDTSLENNSQPSTAASYTSWLSSCAWPITRAAVDPACSSSMQLDLNHKMTPLSS
jgi:hypothetical protein